MFVADWFTAAPISWARGATVIRRACRAGPMNRLAAPTRKAAANRPNLWLTAILYLVFLTLCGR
jgi:hypothetical protein